MFKKIKLPLKLMFIFIMLLPIFLLSSCNKEEHIQATKDMNAIKNNDVHLSYVGNELNLNPSYSILNFNKVDRITDADVSGKMNVLLINDMDNSLDIK